jgi:hypothetical protein
MTTQQTASNLIQTAISLDKKDGSVWQKTGMLIFEQGIGLKGDVKAMTEAFYLEMNNGAKEVPTHGPKRNGEVIVLRDPETGAIKWSAWKVTARICQNMNEIIKCIDNYDLETVFPQGTLLPRHKIVDLNNDAKAPEAPLKTIERNVKAMTEAMRKTTSEDSDDLEKLVQTVMVTLAEIKIAHSVKDVTPVAKVANA